MSKIITLISLWLYGIIAYSQEPISKDAFKSILYEFSEKGGDYPSDNLISNELTYLNILEDKKLAQLKGEGAYIGVGPEQNFSYIGYIKPKIAFIVDIRPECQTEHLMYKAIFQISDTPEQFLNHLFGLPKKSTDSLWNIEKYFTNFTSSKQDKNRLIQTFQDIVCIIENDFAFTLTNEQKTFIQYVLTEFYEKGKQLVFSNKTGLVKDFPTFEQIILAKTPSGLQKSFLADLNSYNYLREMHTKNLIIPLIGDFSGVKTFNKIANYLNTQEIPLSVFYVSNVESCLDKTQYEKFMSNLKLLPIDDNSIFIRYYANNTSVQKIAVFKAHYTPNICFANFLRYE